MIVEASQAARVIEEMEPDVVAFELCGNCHESLIGQERAEEDIKIHELLAGSKILLLLVQMLMSINYKKIQEERSNNSGSDIAEAVAVAQKAGLLLESLEENESAILERFWTGISFLDKLQLVFFTIKIKLITGRDKKQRQNAIANDAVSQMISDLRLLSPAASDALKMEREAYLAHRLFQLSRMGRVLIVVDAGHQEMIKRTLERIEAGVEKAKPRKEPGRKILLIKIMGAALSLLVLAVMARILVNAQSSEKMVLAFVIWFVITGGLSALGVILARGHPLSAFTALMMAWLTTLIPFVAAGLFAGTVEAWKLNPTVGDLRMLNRADSLELLMQNRLFKVVLVTVMANIGSIAGMFVGAYIIWQRLELMNPSDLIKGILS